MLLASKILVLVRRRLIIIIISPFICPDYWWHVVIQVRLSPRALIECAYMTSYYFVSDALLLFVRGEGVSLLLADRAVVLIKARTRFYVVQDVVGSGGGQVLINQASSGCWVVVL